MRKKTAITHTQESKSLKTFFLYAALVFIVIIISLTWKAVTIIQNSKFDGQHQFILAIGQNDRVEEIIAFRPGAYLSVLEIQDNSIPLASVAKTLGVPLDGKINVGSNISINSDVSSTMTNLAWKYNAIESDVTIYDIIRFILLSKNLSTNNQITESLPLPKKEREINKIIANLFTDDVISSENISIQILNATDTPGMGKRLERVLVNMGANVVAVSTLHKKQAKSKIQYFGNETYTLKKLENILEYPVSTLPRETIAHIVITIGEDSKNTSRF